MASAALSESSVLTTVFEPKAVSVPAGAAEWLARFERTYREAGGDPARIPWADRKPCPSMMAWLNAEAPAHVRCGARTAVVGCGLGEDAVALAERGYDVVAFDCSPTALEWAKRLHPDHSDLFVHADLFALPARMRHRFDLVVEVHTLQSMPPEFWPALAAGMASLLSPRGGVLLAVCRGRAPGEPLDRGTGPPFPLTSAELCGLMEANELTPVRAPDEFLDDESPPVRRIRAAFRHF